MFEGCGVPEADAATAADSILQADLYGFYTHGIFKFPNHIDRLKKGASNPAPEIATVRESPATASRP